MAFNFHGCATLLRQWEDVLNFAAECAIQESGAPGQLFLIFNYLFMEEWATMAINGHINNA